MCASSHFKGINETIRIGILTCITNFGFNHCFNGEMVTNFTLSNNDMLWGGIESVKVIKVDFGNQLLVIDVPNGKTDEMHFGDANIDTLVCILEQLENHLKLSQT